MPRIVLLLAWFVSQGSERGQGAEQCGGVLTSARGLIQTPRFPGRLPTPLHCRWVLDATYLSEAQDASIVVYFTQLFVSTGLTFTEFDYYEPDSTFQLGGRVIHRVTEQNVTTVQWLLTRRPYLVIDLALDRLEGSHLRALDGLLDVYGLNMTYETRRGAVVRNDTCSVVGCSLSGHCYADADYSEYWCECFPGFSGPDCGRGPLCRPDHCLNGGSCRQAGAAAVLCICPEGFTGSKCEVLLQENGCGGGDEEGCTTQCPEDGTGEPCVCGTTTVPAARDRARYEGTVRLTNVSAVRSCLESPSCTLKPMLTKQISKYLRATNLSVMEDLRVIDVGFSGEVRFHFWGGKRDGGRVRESLNRLVQRGRLGNVSLVPTHLAITQEPTLHLQSVRVNQARPVVRQGDEFILSCFAQGSSHMMFRWFKDGVYINITKARRSMWTRLLPLDSAEQYTALLGVEGADRLDGGRYTCQVADWGYQQCRSIALDVLQAPQVKLDPVTLTVDKGENVTVKCTSPDELQYDARLGYSWTRNNALFKMTPGLEYWEDLYPGGSILRVANVQRSVTYSCHVHGGSRPASRSVRLELLAAAAPPCAAEGGWPRTGPGVAAAVECPPPYAGLATRLCLLVDRALAAWQTPDYSDCVSDRIAALADNFQRVTLGHGNWTARDVLGGVASALRERGTPLPGEGEPLVALLRRVATHLADTGGAAELADATDRFYAAVSELLRHRNAIINHQRVDELHQVAGQWALAWGGQPGTASTHLALDSLVVDLFRYDPSALRRNLAITLPRPTLSYPNWYTSRVALHIEANKKSQNASSAVAVITYNDLSQFLPQRYSQVLENGSEVQYEAGSALVSVLGRGSIRVTSEIELQLGPARPGWQVGCGLARSPSLRWNLSACQATPAQDGNATLCRCPQLGTYAALLVKAINLDRTSGRRGSAPRAVLVGCLCCLVQSALALALLSLRLYRHATWITFLKLQCCCATASAMLAFLYATSRNLPQDIYPSVSVVLQASILVSMSTHLSKVLLVYTEVVNLPTVKHLRPTVICIITGVPLLVVLLNHIAQSTTDSPLGSWWLVWDSLMSYTCLACGSLLVAAFLFLYYQVTRRLCGLKLLKSSDTKRAVLRRQGLLNRAAIVLTATVIMSATSTLYVNNPSPRCQYFFSFSCALLGFVVLVCYVLHCESPLLHLLTAFKIDNSFGSESDSSPLNIFTKQEADRECEGAPLRVSETALVVVGTVVGNGKAEPVREAPPILKGRAEDCKPPPSRPKAVTFHNDLVTGCDRGAVDMELYPGSPRRLMQAPDGGGGGARLCVITSVLVDAPSAVVCSVDVEPRVVDAPLPPSLPVPSPSSTAPASLPIVAENRSEPVTPDGDEGDVMDRICHDLDYLLGRLPAEAKPELPRLEKHETEEQTSL